MRTDTLTDVAREIETGLAELDLVNYPCGNLEMLWGREPQEDDLLPDEPAGSCAVLEWDSAQEGWKGFLKTAKSLKATVVYTKLKKFSWRQDFYEYLDEGDELSADELASLQVKARPFQSCDGFVAYILLAFKLNDVWHVYQETAGWYKEYLDLVDG